MISYDTSWLWYELNWHLFKYHKITVVILVQNVSLTLKDFNYVQFLQEIAAEQLFEVTYVDIEEKAVSGKSQCLVQLSTLPVAVCYGCGMTPKEAQASAAQNALEYLKIMTKKWAQIW